MSDLRTLHSEAMDLAERAMIDRAKGNTESAKKLLRAALEKEQAAASIAVRDRAPEPTRSILLKSAAHLAVDAGELRLAEQLIGNALAGEPPEEIACELRAVFEEVGFHRHLDLHGIELQSNDAQLVLVGSAIAPGMAEADEFTRRVNTIERLVQRTSESERSVKYREQGPPTQQVERSLKLFVGLPRAASYAVSLRVAGSKDQAEFQFAESAQVLDLVVERLKMYDAEDYAALGRVIPDRQYYDNFIQLASALAPDGERVRLVGLTMMRDGKERRLEMRRPAKTDSRGVGFETSKEPLKLYGRVFFINTKDQDNPVIKLETEDGTDFRLKADGHLLQKAVVFAASGSRVSVSGLQLTRTMLQVDDLSEVKARPSPKGASRKIAKVRKGVPLPASAQPELAEPLNQDDRLRNAIADYGILLSSLSRLKSKGGRVALSQRTLDKMASELKQIMRQEPVDPRKKALWNARALALIAEQGRKIKKSRSRKL